MVDVAQLVRASDCDSEGRGFESHLPPQNFVLQNFGTEQSRGAYSVLQNFGPERSRGAINPYNTPHPFQQLSP